MQSPKVRSATLAVVIVAGTIAAAAKDLPRGAAYHASSPCESFGPGYVQVAGSQTCIRLSGSVSISATVTSGGSAVGAFLTTPRR